MNKINKCVFIALSNMFAIACYAMVTDTQKTVSFKKTVNCADIKDPAKQRECFDRQQELLDLLG